MKTQEKVHATIASGLGAGRTLTQIIQLHNLSKSTMKRVKRHYDNYIARGGLPEDFEFELQMVRSVPPSPPVS
jgi:hypothetical protein